MVTRKLRVNYA